MKLSQLTSLSSERGIRSALSALIFGAKQRLLSASVTHERITRTIHNLRQAGYNDRASDVENGKAFVKAETNAYAAAEQLSILVAKADELGIVIDLELEPTMRRLMDQKQLALAAEAAGLTEEEIAASALKAAKLQFDAEKQAAMHAQGLFYSASGDDTDLDIKADSVLSALMRERGRILTYSNILPYLGELTLLKNDIAIVEHIIANTVDGEAPEITDDVVEQITAPKAVEAKRRRVVKAKKAEQEGCEIEDIRDAEIN